MGTGKKGTEHKAEKKIVGLKVLAAQTLKIASINGLGKLDKLENELEDEINYDNRSPAKTRFGRFRREGEHYLHSKAVLFIIVLMNIIDTLLVMIGLILDFHHVSLSLGAKSEMLTSFTEDLGKKYHIEEKETEVLQKLLNSHIIFNVSAVRDNATNFAAGCASFLNDTAARNKEDLMNYTRNLLSYDAYPAESSVCFQPFYSGNETFQLTSTGEVEDELSIVAHKLHYCSISILSLLVIILVLKLVCFGRRFFKERMLVFDGVVTIISFVLDIVFMNGVTFFTQEQFVIILTLLFPWRVIRILNSLIAAVLDHHKLNLKILYTQKKKISRSLTETTSKVELLQRHIEVLQNLCFSRGIHDMDVSRALSGDTSGGHKNGAGGGLASMMALGKLAFQAADAFAPISNGYDKNTDGSTSGGSSPNDSPSKSETAEVTSVSENNNAILKNENDSVQDTGIRRSANSDTVSIHVNGSGPPRARGAHETTVSLPDLTDHKENFDSHFDSRL